jgi:hypothetical protein
MMIHFNIFLVEIASCHWRCELWSLGTQSSEAEFKPAAFVNREDDNFIFFGVFLDAKQL